MRLLHIAKCVSYFKSHLTQYSIITVYIYVLLACFLNSRIDQKYRERWQKCFYGNCSIIAFGIFTWPDLAWILCLHSHIFWFSPVMINVGAAKCTKNSHKHKQQRNFHGSFQTCSHLMICYVSTLTILYLHRCVPAMIATLTHY